MTRLVVDGRERTDVWDHLADDEAPGCRSFTVGISRWLEERNEIVAHVEGSARLLGVRLAIDSDPTRLAPDIERFALIVIEIPSSADGRFFSIAARIREHLRYRGELRVVGDVASDQLAFMRRCGINAFVIGDGIDVERFVRRYECFYQSGGPMADDDDPIRLARRRLALSRPRVGSGDIGAEAANG